jgi:hypothetical protein
MIITVYRSTPPGGPWLLQFDDGTPPKHWTAPPLIEAHLLTRLGGETVGRFEGEWRGDGLAIGERIADA